MKIATKLVLGTTTMIVASATGLRAQVVEKRTLTLEGARTVMAAAVSEARKLDAPGGAIAIVDDGGHLVLLERLDNTFPAATSVATGKARTAAQFRRPTSSFENAIKSGRLSLTAVAEMVPLQGGVPVTMNGEIVGAIGVSGAASAQQDDDIATAASTALENAKAAR